MRIVFVGSVEFSKNALEKLINLKTNITGVITKERSSFNTDFVDLSQICKRNSIPYKYVKNINSLENIDWVKSLKPDVIFCFGWSQILKKEFLDIASMVIGFHPAELPKNRGRHPIVWALALGLEKTASSFFFMDEGIDSGDILSQVDVNIAYEDNAMMLYEKITNTAIKQLEELLPQLQNNSFKRIPQDNSKANYWRKRSQKDGEVDFRMNSRAIHNLVRSLTKPYVGAHILYKGKEIKIWEVEEMEVDLKNIESGKVLNLIDGQILVKCCDKAVILIKHEFNPLPEIGEYLI